jgi:hypothetical protein
VHGSATAGWLIVALCAAAGGYCLLRLRSGVPQQRGSAGGEALMGFGMAAMAVPATTVTPPRWLWLVYAAVFAGAALHTLVAGRSSAHRLRHLLGMLTMVYMAGAMAAVPDGAHGAHAAAGAPVVTGVLLVYYAGYVLWAGSGLLPVPAVADTTRGGSATSSWGDRPELVPACRLSMGIAMLAMLLAL